MKESNKNLNTISGAKKKYFVLVLVLITTITSQAQHCFWDLSTIIIVDVRDSKTGNIINGLEITLADSIGNPIIKHNQTFNNKLIFDQNLKKPSEEVPSMEQRPLCEDCYMLIVSQGFSRKNEKLSITIKDIDNENNFSYFEPEIIKVKPENIPSLCRENPIWESVDAVNKMKINVTLKRKE